MQQKIEQPSKYISLQCYSKLLNDAVENGLWPIRVKIVVTDPRPLCPLWNIPMVLLHKTLNDVKRRAVPSQGELSELGTSGVRASSWLFWTRSSKV